MDLDEDDICVRVFIGSVIEMCFKIVCAVYAVVA